MSDMVYFPKHILLLPILIFSFAMSLTLLSYSLPANAAPDIAGTFSGTITHSPTNCRGGSTDSTKSESATFNITQSGSNFSGSGSVGNKSITNLTGSIDAQGNTTGSSFIVNDNGVTNVTITSGKFNDNTLTISGTWEDSTYSTPGTGCTGTFSGKLIRGGSTVISPLTPSSILTAPMMLSTQVKAITGDIGARVGDALRGTASGPRKTASGLMWEGQSGLNAGDGVMSYGVWGSYSYSSFKNDFASTAFDGHRHNLLAGVDISPWESTVFGVAVGYDRSDIDTSFNQGSQGTNGETISVYAGHLLNKTWSIDASGGYSFVDTKQYRTDPTSSSRVSSAPSGNRWFGNLNLNGYTQWGNWLIGGRTGLLYARSDQDSFTESNGASISKFTSELGQWSIGGDVAYSLDKFEPFVRLVYENDFSMQKLAAASGAQPSNDNDNFLFGAGLRYFGSKNLTGNLEFSKRLGRDNFDEDTITATLRMDF